MAKKTVITIEDCSRCPYTHLNREGTWECNHDDMTPEYRNLGPNNESDNDIFEIINSHCPLEDAD